ncbi:hypothetical protein [Geminicoccus harenae]|uniref:hypothetical protein n=1 Tax=Geminicoccus harenae TaxID=2498453 RepID=UPI00168AF40C|nr:hypothetical protein [Geminicoccus harenae]
MSRRPADQPAVLHFVAVAAFALGMALLAAAGADQRQAHRLFKAVVRQGALPPVRGSPPRRRRRIVTRQNTHLQLKDFR